MSNVTPFQRPINWSRLRADEAERIVRDRAQPDRTGQVVLTDHAWDRVGERDITRADVFRILREGRCHDPPSRNDNGDWQVIMTKRLAGQREAGAVTVIIHDKDMLVIRTVQWMDVR